MLELYLRMKLTVIGYETGKRMMLVFMLVGFNGTNKQ
jgi:hypothetical protein